MSVSQEVPLWKDICLRCLLFLYYWCIPSLYELFENITSQLQNKR